MAWTQPVCDPCWDKQHPGQPHPGRLVEEYRETERCCHCGTQTRSGLYDRIDPATVPFPAS